MYIQVRNSKQEAKKVTPGEHQTTRSAYNLTLPAITRAVFSPDYRITFLPRRLPKSASREGIAEIRNQDCITGGRGGSNTSSLPRGSK